MSADDSQAVPNKEDMHSNRIAHQFYKLKIVMALRVLSRAIAPAKRITTREYFSSYGHACVTNVFVADSSLLAPSTRQLHTSVNVLAIAIEFDGVTQPRAADKL